MPSHTSTGRINIWKGAAWLIALLTVLPLSVIVLSWTRPALEIWQHMAENLLADLLVNTVLLGGGVVGLTGFLGVSLAWFTGACDFPGRRIFSWALLLPLAMPTYVLAFVFLGIFDFTGPVQTFLRDLLGRSVWFPDIRSTAGVILVMSLALYPYVYLLARSAFLAQGKQTIEAAQSLGCTSFAAFFRVALPMARPWIAGGLLLVLMETLADFGAVSIFNYDTFTTAIYKAWYGFFSIDAAAQLSSLLVIIVLAVLLLEQRLRRGRKYSESARVTNRVKLLKLEGAAGWGASVFASIVLLTAFILPFGQLMLWCLDGFADFDTAYVVYLGHSLLLSGMAGIFICCCALLLAYVQRQHPGRVTSFLVRLATLGYALPGTVLAVGLVIVISLFDKQLASITGAMGIETTILFQGTILTMLLAYAVRFMAAGYNGVHSSMEKITLSIDEASQSLGITGVKMIRKIHVPILRSGLLTAGILVFVDVMKEMPITLMTRPFGWDTLAVKIFELTSEGEWQRAALPAVALVAGGIIPLIFLTKQMDKS
ncbi:MAG: iron ABC transporter permease [Desulfobulbaceae bacterium]|nr:iron ABC transporter permease [Desulfobulbaceae bacterium]